MADTKTNCVRILEESGALLGVSGLEGEFTDALEMARTMGRDPDRVFKTLVTVGKTGNYYVFMVPCAGKLDLKKAAALCGEKHVEMILQKDLLKITGYLHGGCSPVGMKKQFPTWIDETCILFDSIYISAGKVGLQAQVKTETFLDKFPVTAGELLA